MTRHNHEAMHDTVTLALAVVTLATAIVAAIYWFRSTAVKSPSFEEPKASIDDAPAAHMLTAVVNINAIRQAMDESARLNKAAASWTGVSAFVGAVTSVVGTLS